MEVIKNVFHGSNANFHKFSISDIKDGGFFFTDNEEMASSYTRKTLVKKDKNFGENLWNAFQSYLCWEEYREDEGRQLHLGKKFFMPLYSDAYDGFDFDPEDSSSYYEFETELDAWDYFLKNIEIYVSVIFNVNLHFENPLIIDGEYSNWDRIPFMGKNWCTRGLVFYAQQNGYDSVIIENIYDYGCFYSERNPGNVFVAFSDEQIEKIGADNWLYSYQPKK